LENRKIKEISIKFNKIIPILLESKNKTRNTARQRMPNEERTKKVVQNLFVDEVLDDSSDSQFERDDTGDQEYYARIYGAIGDQIDIPGMWGFDNREWTSSTSDSVDIDPASIAWTGWPGTDDEGYQRYKVMWANDPVPMEVDSESSDDTELLEPHQIEAMLQDWKEYWAEPSDSDEEYLQYRAEVEETLALAAPDAPKKRPREDTDLDAESPSPYKKFRRN